MIAAVFVALLGLVYALYSKNQASYDLPILIAADVVLALLSVLAYVMTSNALKTDNPNAFLRAKMSSTMLRIFICVAGLGTYAYLNGRTPYTKPTIFLVLGMYVVYTILESAVLSKKSRIGK